MSISMSMVKSFLHGFCHVAQMSMRTRTMFPLTRYSSDLVSDISSELQCLVSPYAHTHHTYIHATCKRRV